MRSRSRRLQRCLTRLCRVPPPAPKDEVSLRPEDTKLERRDDRRAAKPVSNPSQEQERAFLVGVEFRARSRPGGKSKPGAMTAGAQAARDHVASASATLPPDSPDFSWEESLDELRNLATSAGAKIAGEFTQRRDRPEPATLIGKGKLEEIAAPAAS